MLSLLMISCGDDDPVLEPVEAMIVTNLEALTTSGPGQPPAGDYVKFSFEKQTVVEGDDWDIAFRASLQLPLQMPHAQKMPSRRLASR